MTDAGRGGDDVGGDARSLAGDYGSLLRNRNYRLWFFSSLGSSLGDWVGLFALQVLVLSLAEPGSRIALFGLGGIMMARLLPSIVFGPISGVIADRYDRKVLMVATDFARGAVFLGIAFSRELWLLFALTFVVECLSLIYMSAKDASLPAIIERSQLTQANQMNLLVNYGPLPFGAVAATAIVWLANFIENFGIEIDPILLALLLNAGTFVIAGFIIARLALPSRGPRTSEDSGGMISEVRAGISFIWNLQVIRTLIIGVVAVFFGAGVVVTLGPEFVRSVLGRSSTDWFRLMTTFGFGLLIGIALGPVARRRVGNERIFPVALCAAAVLVLVISVMNAFALVLPLGFLLGTAAGLSFVSGYTLLHEHTEDEVRARTFAVFYTTTRIAMFSALGVSPFVAGALGSEVSLFGLGPGVSGVRITMFVGGGVALAGALVSLRGLGAEQDED